MITKDLIKNLALHTDVPPAVAADGLDRLVVRILKNLRRGAPVPIPGLGVLRPAEAPRQEVRIVTSTSEGKKGG